MYAIASYKFFWSPSKNSSLVYFLYFTYPKLNYFLSPSNPYALKPINVFNESLGIFIVWFATSKFIFNILFEIS